MIFKVDIARRLDLIFEESIMMREIANYRLWLMMDRSMVKVIGWLGSKTIIQNWRIRG